MADSILNLLLNIRKAGKGDKEAASGIDQMGKKLDGVLKNARQNSQTLTHTVGAVGKLLGDAFKLAADEAQRLGRSEVTAQMKEMNDSFKTVTDTLVQIPIGGRDFLGWMGDAAEGAANLGKTVAALSIYIAKATGSITEEEAALRATALVTDESTEAVIGLSKAQLAAMQAAEDVRDQYDYASIYAARAKEETEKLTKAQGDLAIILSGPVGSELDAYYERQKDAGAAIADTKLKIEELNTKKYLTPEQKTELDGLTQTLKDQQTVYAENATAHELATARIVLGFIQQQMAADGLSADEIVALADIGKAWGIYDEKTAAVLKAVTLSVEKHGADSKAILDDLDKTVSNLPDYKDFVYNIVVRGQIPDAGVNDAPGGSGNAYSGGGEPPPQPPPDGGYTGFASGTEGWMTVPAGYPNDSYRVGLSSGEAFAVVPSNQTTTTNMGGITINVNGASDPRAVAQEVSRVIAAQTRAYRQAGQR